MVETAQTVYGNQLHSIWAQQPLVTTYLSFRFHIRKMGMIISAGRNVVSTK